ncbi:MAG: acetolactate synthase small subunit [Candidatus Bathyarchaeota archaeon]
MPQQRHILSTIVENKPGVLFRITNTIRRRGFNIESLTVGPIDDGKLARMTIVIYAEENDAEFIARNLHRLVEVFKVKRLDPDKSVLREMALIKVCAEDSRTRSDVVHFSRIFRGRIVDVSHNSMVIEITGSPEKINAFIDLVKNHGIKEVARTGLVALQRGGEAI